MTRRTLGRLLASGVMAPVVVISQTTDTNDDQKAVAEQMRSNAQLLDKVKLPMATEPAFRFKA